MTKFKKLADSPQKKAQILLELPITMTKINQEGFHSLKPKIT